MRNKYKSFLSLFVVFTLFFSCFPCNAFAAEIESWDYKQSDSITFVPSTAEKAPFGIYEVESPNQSMIELQSSNFGKDNNDISYLQISFTKYGEEIAATSIAGNTMVEVLEETKWKLSAQFVEVKDGKAKTKDVTKTCTWETGPDVYAPILFSESTHTAHIMGGFKRHDTATIEAKYIVNGETTENYSARITFQVVHLKINSDAEALRCLSLHYLTMNQWDALKSNAGKKISSFAYYLETSDGNALPTIQTKADKNSATYSHFLAEAAGEASIVECIDGDDLRACVFSYNGINYLVFAGRERTSGEGFEKFCKVGLPLYRDATEKYGNNIVVSGAGTSGIVATYVSYMTGCRSLTFNAHSPMVNIYMYHFPEFCKYYNIESKRNYILSDAVYNENLYHIEPYYVVNRQNVNTKKGGLELLASMISYQPNAEQVSLVKSELKRSDTPHPPGAAKSLYLGNEQNNTKSYSASELSAMFGGGGDDVLQIYSNALTEPDAALRFTGKVIFRLNTFASIAATILHRDFRWLHLIDGMQIGVDAVSGDGQAVIVDLLGSISKIGLAFSVPMLLKDLGMDLAASLYPLNDFFVGGKGNDVLSGTSKTDWYIYHYGDGSDVIYDGIGENFDGILLSNCENKNIEFEYDKSGSQDWDILKIYIDNTLAITFEIESSGVAVFSGNSFDKKEEIGVFCRLDWEMIDAELKEIHEAGCPVDMLVYDGAGNVVQELLDGSEYESYTDYGAFSVTKNGDDYIKTAVLYDDSYRVEICGNEDGVMNYKVARFNGEDELPDFVALENVPIVSGALYYPADSLDEEILSVDTDGDGVIDASVEYDTVVTLSQSSLELHYSDSVKLEAEVATSSISKDFFWMCSDNSVATIDENGTVTAVGYGDAKILAIALDGSGRYAECTVSVQQEMISAEDFTVSGLEETYQFEGVPINISADVSYHGIPLIQDIDFTIDFSELSEPGTAEMTIRGIGMFTGEKVLQYNIAASKEPETVTEKVDWIAEECRKEGIDGEWEIALWLHDWLIYNANYDYTYTYFSPEGVLLYGTGVCQSYADAYALLLNEFSIENQVIASPEMDHAWNLIKIDGEWCHVDCTWDDPGIGGAENYVYFGMNDALISRDHVWDTSAYPASSSKSDYYFIRNKSNVVENAEEFIAFLDGCAGAQMTEFECYYIGDDADFSLFEQFMTWASEFDWKFGLLDYSVSGTGWMIKVLMEYTEPWDEPTKFPDIVDCPNFVLRGSEGVYRLSDYSNNGMVLIFGRAGCYNTRALLENMNDRTKALNQQGVEVFMVLEGATTADDFIEMKSDFPNFTYVYEDGFVMSNLLEAVGSESGWVTYPLVYVIDKDAKIVHYTSGYVTQMNELMEKANGVATGQALPNPGKTDENYIGSYFNYTGDKDALTKMIEEQLSTQSNHIVVRDGTWSGSAEEWTSDMLGNLVFEILGQYRSNICSYDISDSWRYYTDLQAIYVPVTYKSTGHSPELKNEKHPTSTESGYTGDWICSICGIIVEKGKEIPKLDEEPTITPTNTPAVIPTAEPTKEPMVTPMVIPTNPATSTVTITPTVTPVPVPGASDAIKEIETNVVNGEASVSVSEDDMDSLIRSAINSDQTTLTLKVVGTDGADRVAVEIPKQSLSDITFKDGASLDVVTVLGTISLDKQVLDAVVNTVQTDFVRLVIEKEQLDAVYKDFGLNASVTKIFFQSGDTKITDIDTDKINISLPVIDALQGKDLAVTYTDTDGKWVKLSGKYMTTDNDRYQFETPVLGNLVLAEETAVDAFIQNQDKQPTETPADTPTATLTDTPSVTPTNTPSTSTIPKKGTILKSKNVTYKITKKGSEISYIKTSSTVASVTIPATVKISGITYKVTSIASNAFKGNKRLSKMTIGKNITSIGKNAFRGCENLKTVTIKSKKLKSVGKNVFKGIKSNAKIKVPSKKQKAYTKLLKGKGQGKEVKITR